MVVLNRIVGRSHSQAQRFSALTRASFLALISLFFLSSAPAQPISPEYKVKAVFLYNFVQFVDWPSTAFADEESPVIIGVLGTDPFGKILDETIQGEIVKNRKLEVRRYKFVSEIKNCHVLFIHSSEAGKMNSHLARLRGRGILTVSDEEDFTRKGGMIQFVTEKNKVRFKINVGEARAANLSISAKLLQLAEIVSTDSRP